VGFDGHVHHFVFDLVMAKDHKTIPFAAEGMLQGEMGIAIITAKW
jgi:hypothetical protein